MINAGHLSGFGSRPATSAWEFISSSSFTNVATGTVLTLPRGTQRGDLVVAVGCSNGSNNPAFSGFTSVYSTSATSFELRMSLLFPVTTQTTTTMTVSSGNLVSVILITYRPNVNFNFYYAVIDEYAAIDDQTSNQMPNCPAIGPTTKNNIVLAIGWIDATVESSSLPNATNYFEAIGASSLYISEFLHPSDVSFDPPTYSGSNTANWSAGTFVIRGSALNRFNTISFSSNTVYAGSTVVESQSQTIVGEGGPWPISIDVGEYRINGGAWTSSAGTISLGDVVQLRGTSPALSGSVGVDTSTSTTLTVGSTTRNWWIISARSLYVVATTVNFVVPSGITSLSVIGVGPGGAAGALAVSVDGNTYYTGGAGGGGCMSRTPSLGVTPGETLVIEGPGAGSGTPTSIKRSGTTIWSAASGSNGTDATIGVPGTGGAGGSTAASVGTTKYAGGKGGNGVSVSALNISNYMYGGGGGAGGYTGAGGAGGAGSSNPAAANNGTAGTGGAGGGGASGQEGGDVGLEGAGANGSAGTISAGPGIGSPSALGFNAGGSNNWGAVRITW